MLFSKDFFDLNLRFARRVADVTGQSIQKSLLEYTHLYLAFGLGRDFDPENPIWQDYLGQVGDSADQVDGTYRFYLERMAKQPKQQPENSFGCFSYALWEGNHVRLHFRNAKNECQFISLWGQFLFYDGNVRPHVAELLLEGIETQKTLEGLKSCFPYPVLRLQSSIEDFYACYGIE